MTSMNLKSGCYVCETQEEFDYLKAKTTKLRTILLERKEKNMFCKLSSFDKRTKDKFIKEINEMWNSMSDEEINEEFNAICCDKLFEGGQDISSYPVKEMNFADHSSLYEPASLSCEELKASA
jgi:hypothetical protein